MKCACGAEMNQIHLDAEVEGTPVRYAVLRYECPKCKERCTTTDQAVKNINQMNAAVLGYCMGEKP